MLQIYTPEKAKKPKLLWCFQGAQNENIGQKCVTKLISKTSCKSIAISKVSFINTYDMCVSGGMRCPFFGKFCVGTK